MDYFPQFKWAVPYAFTEAIAHCLFTHGDILYDNKAAYTECEWESRVDCAPPENDSKIKMMGAAHSTDRA